VQACYYGLLFDGSIANGYLNFLNAFHCEFEQNSRAGLVLSGQELGFFGCDFEGQPIGASIAGGDFVGLPPYEAPCTGVTIEIGRPPAPRSFVASRAPDSGHLLLTWEAPVTDGITGYRVYRATTAGGPYELVGLSLGTVFEDWVSPHYGQTDYYVVTTYDQVGVQSVYSVEAAAAPWEGQRAYLPMVVK
jgi:hypothetical protein